MVVFGQKWLFSGKTSGFSRLKWFYSGNVVVFGQNWLYWLKVVVMVQKWLYLDKVVVFGQK